MSCCLLLHTDDPSDGDELKEPDDEERERARELIPQLEQVDSVTKDKRKTHQEHYRTDHSWEYNNKNSPQCVFH